jgi:hypothetical protein
MRYEGFFSSFRDLCFVNKLHVKRTDRRANGAS